MAGKKKARASNIVGILDEVEHRQENEFHPLSHQVIAPSMWLYVPEEN